MVILPAIDIKDRKCVRLYQGDFETAEQVAESYLDTARLFAQQGAEWIHMVDLDGAKSGAQVNKEIFIDVARSTQLRVEVGGGIRSLDNVEAYLQSGIARVILGSTAISNPQLVKTAAKEFGDRVAVGIDARNGKVATEGWLETSNVLFWELALRMCEFGVKYFIFTDIAKDGTLTGPNQEQTKLLQEKILSYGASVIASGGVHHLNDLITLKQNGIYGAICGKAIYSGNIDLKEAIAVCS